MDLLGGYSSNEDKNNDDSHNAAPKVLRPNRQAVPAISIMTKPKHGQ